MVLNAKRWVSLLTLLGAASFLVACGPPPKPKELERLEAMRDESEVARINAAAPKMLEKSDKLYKMARKAWQDDELDRAREYAWLGQVRYQTAEALAQAEGEKKRFDVANTQAGEVRVEVDQLTAEITTLQSRIEAHEVAIAAMKNSASKKAQTGVEAALLEVEALRAQAQGVNADTHAPGPWNMAENILTLAREHLAAGRHEEAQAEIEEARKAYQEALATAQPEFDKAQGVLASAENEKQLFEAANKAFGANSFQEGRGVLVVLPELFKKGKSSALQDREYMVDKVYDIAAAYPAATVMISGYTQSKGSTSKNLTLSQERADNVRDLLMQRGIAGNRIIATGYGEDSPRYDNSESDTRGKNDRVEVLFVMTK